MPQLVGSECAGCHARIRLAYDAEFCQECGNPVHTQCLCADPTALIELQCIRCGGDRESAMARTVRAERIAEAEAAKAAEVRLNGHPKSKVCPNCGCSDYATIRTSQGVAFTDDRICAKCSTRYTPPTPIWAAILFVIIGSAFLVASMLDVLSVCAELADGKLLPARLIATGIVFGLAIAGGFAIRHGIRCLRNPGTQ